jgi:hypothetical protein
MTVGSITLLDRIPLKFGFGSLESPLYDRQKMASRNLHTTVLHELLNPAVAGGKAINDADQPLRCLVFKPCQSMRPESIRVGRDQRDPTSTCPAQYFTK